jgi:mono/diheme cytochrome c family protein
VAKEIVLRAAWLILAGAWLLSAATVDQQAADILKANCLACHGAKLKVSKLDLRSREAMLKGGEKGAAIAPGHAEESRLYRYVAGLDQPTMPPGKTLSAADIATLKTWIESGAQLPEIKDDGKDAALSLAKAEERPITQQERNWWAFQKPKQAPLPQVTNPLWSKNPIDRFIAAQLASKNLRPNPTADRRTLIRRAYLDLTGLVPTPSQVDAFVNDKSANAWERVVDGLLASPYYGEKWARLWLDLVRYADSGGYEYDNDRPHAFRYRDWVVNALNQDLPYDEFVRLQLAGDEYRPGDREALVATSYLRLGGENNLKNEQTRLDELDDMIATTANSLLGVTVQCARCHNHKFDPIPQKDYYQMQAVFYPLKAKDQPLVSESDYAAWKLANKAVDDEQKPLKQKIAALEKPYRDRIIQQKRDALPDYIKQALATPPEKRTEGQKLNATQVEKTVNLDPQELDAIFPAEGKAERARLQAEIEQIEKKRTSIAMAMSIEEPGRKAPESHFLHRGSPGSRGTVMKPGILSVTSEQPWKYEEPPADSKTSYRRKGFADWVTHGGNPLTARVMVNRLWAGHFGEGIVRTPSNYGKTGESPTNQALLDWLAVDFMQSGWSMKKFHRQVMLSEAYRMSSADQPEGLKADPENRSLWRQSRRRLEGELIRDNALLVSGILDQKLGGPAVLPFIDPALFQASSKRTWNGVPDDDPSTWRRSLYIFNKRTIAYPMLEAFDKPDTMIHCSRRNRSTTAPQALILMNNAASGMYSAKFAERLAREAKTTANQVTLGYQLAYSRKPLPQELAAGVKFAKSEGLAAFCHALVNSNEFVFQQ